LDDEKGVVCNQPFMGLEFGLAGAVLMELALLKRIKADQHHLEIIDDSPTSNQIFDDALAMINQQSPQEDAKYWVWKLGIHIQEIKDYFIKHLIELGILEKKEKNILWVYRRKCYPLIDDEVEQEVKERIRETILEGKEPLPRDVVLISLMRSCNLTGQIFSRAEEQKAQKRIENIAQIDVIGQAVYKAIYEILQKLSVQQLYY
jgi:hypothetical protein